MPWWEKGGVATLVGVVFMQYASGVRAEQHCEESVGRFASLEGSVEIQVSAKASWRAAGLNDHLCEGDSVRMVVF